MKGDVLIVRIKNMSHSSGQVKFEDGTIMHFEYDGTNDFVINKLFNTFEEMWNNWRTYDYQKCSCGTDEQVEIATNYGDGFSWDGKACKTCKAFTKGIKPKYQDKYYELPNWWKKRTIK
jgi:hypothetical protein